MKRHNCSKIHYTIFCNSQLLPKVVSQARYKLITPAHCSALNTSKGQTHGRSSETYGSRVHSHTYNNNKTFHPQAVADCPLPPWFSDFLGKHPVTKFIIYMQQHTTPHCEPNYPHFVQPDKDKHTPPVQHTHTLLLQHTHPLYSAHTRLFT